jgi:hypothetical protein
VNKEITELIMECVKNYKELKHTETDWRDPIVGFADAKDELFLKLKEIIGPNHALPADIVSNAKFIIRVFLSSLGMQVTPRTTAVL